MYRVEFAVVGHRATERVAGGELLDDDAVEEGDVHGLEFELGAKLRELVVALDGLFGLLVAARQVGDLARFDDLARIQAGQLDANVKRVGALFGDRVQRAPHVDFARLA